MLPHFFKQFLFWLCFCWRRRHQWHHRPPRCCDCVAAFFQTCFSVFLLEAEGTTPRAFKVLCCRISSNNSFFGCVSAGGGVTSGISDRQGAVTVLLHFFKHVFFCLSAGGIKRCSRSMCIQGAVLVLLQFYSSTNNLFLSACWRHHQCHRDPRCCVVAFLQTCSFLVFLLEESSAAAPPKRSKVLCCCISSTNSFLCFCWRHHQALLPPTAPTPKLRQGKYFMTNGIGSVDHRLQDQPAKKQKVIQSKAGFKWRRVYKIVFKCVFSLTC